jgi:aspartate/methionine/tyrosine aminotransferase
MRFNMNLLNKQFELIRQSPTVAMADRVNALKAKGIKIVGLQTGDPDFSTPTAVTEVALDAIERGLTHYGPSRGTIATRQAAALKLMRDNGVAYNPDNEIMITHGGIHAYYLAMQALINPGDEVLIPDPTWATHANMVTMLRGVAVRIPARAENGFLPDLNDLGRFITPRTKAIVINYPSNPTGVYPSREYLGEMQFIATQHQLWVISDEVYENLYYGVHPTCAGAYPDARDRTIVIQSLSKTYAMTGWRVGYLAAPRVLIDNALKAGQNSITCVAPFIQEAATFALSDPGIQVVASEMRKKYSFRRELVLRLSEELATERILVTPPMGAFYFFLDMRKLSRSSADICEELLDEEMVGLVAGSAFGNCGEGFVRMTIAASDKDVEAGFRSIVAWANRQ